jgi:hydroxymethylbilane synthase
VSSALRIATRRSPLALWQAEYVARLLRQEVPGLEVELVAMTTEGDQRTDRPLAEIGGKGVFVKEVQAAVLTGGADLAVHSAKDLPALTPEGLVLAAVPPRGDPRDALVGRTLEEIPEGGVVGTGSARRRVQLAGLRPDLRFAELRGNMATRLTRAEELDAVVVAAAAMERLGWSDRVAEVIDEAVMVPQVGQGALAVEARADDPATLELLAALDHEESRRRVAAERAFLVELGGDCTLPAGAHAVVRPDGTLEVTGVLGGSADDPLRRDVCRGDDAVEVGRRLAAALRDGSPGEEPGSGDPVVGSRR